MKYADLRLPTPALTGNLQWLRTSLRRILVYSSAAIIAVVITGGIFSFTPLVGLSLAHTQGVSMEPQHEQGDVVLVRSIDGEQAATGDVIVFEDGGQQIMHRVIERYTDASGQLMLVTQGDNVPVPDHPILSSQVSARLVTEIPLLGDMSRLMDAKGGFYVYRSIVISIAVFSVALWGLATAARAERAAEPTDEAV